MYNDNANLTGIDPTVIHCHFFSIEPSRFISKLFDSYGILKLKIESDDCTYLIMWEKLSEKTGYGGTKI